MRCDPGPAVRCDVHRNAPRAPARARGRRIAALPVAVLLAGCILGPDTAAAQETAATQEVATSSDDEIAERCRTPEHRQFDFWIGEWEVRGPDGEVVGHNTIRRAARGCALLEEWRGATGGRGVSVNTYEANREVWTQTWVGDGATLHLEGGLQGEEMVLSGTTPRATPDGEVLDRITWTPLEDGRVRQVWRVSADGGSTWQKIFVGTYLRTDASTTP